MKPVWIELVNSGVANRFEFDDYELIEMNWRLTDYPELYYNVYQHEIEHKSGDFKSADLVHDMKSRTPGLFKFMSKHISSWTQVLPIYWSFRRKQLIYDWSAIISLWLLIVTIVVVYWIIGWVLYVIRNGVS